MSSIYSCLRHLLITFCALLVTASFSWCEKTIITSKNLPDTTPWNLKELSSPPAVEWLKEENGVRSLFYKGLPFENHPRTSVFAYYSTPGLLKGDPTLDKNLPALVLVHGGGGAAFTDWVSYWASNGYAAIAMDLAGCGENRVRLEDGGPNQTDDYKFGAIDKPVEDQWTCHAIANVILAHSLIRSFDEVDADRTAVTGISWGGYLTCITAGADNRFKAAVPVYGCGFLHEDSVWLDWFNKRFTPEQGKKWVQLWDPSMYVGSAEMPVLFVNGGRDFAYPPDSYAKTYALVKSEKRMRYTPELKHGHIFDRPPAIKIFIDSILKGGDPLHKILSVKPSEEGVIVDVDSKFKIVSADLHYTMDKIPGDNKNRQWITKPATVNGKQILAPKPPKDASAWFITVTDGRGALISSELHF